MAQREKRKTVLKLPPQSKEAEISVLGALLIDKDVIISVAESLRAVHFYNPAYRQIYEAIVVLYEEGTPIDLVTVAEQLKKKKALKKVGGRVQLTQLVNAVPTSSHAAHYANIIKNLYVKRELISAAAGINEAAFDEGLSADEALDKSEQLVFSLSQHSLRGVPVSLRDALAESFDRLDELQKRGEGMRGIPTGFVDLDNLLAGLQRSNMIVLAARPGIGKTAFALNMARYVSVEKKLPVCFFSLEMSKEELVDRLLVRQAKIDSWKMKTGRLDEDDFSNLSEAMGILAEAPLYIDDMTALSVLEMRTKARRLQVESGLEMVVIDYMQLIRGRGLENRVQEVSEISQGLKNMARELKVPVLAVSQLNRAVETRGTQRPRLADLRESGCLTADATLVRADTGANAKIGDLVGKGKIPILALNNQWQLKPVKIRKVFSSGKKQTYRLVLKSGKEIKASANHPFLTVFGWLRLDQLALGARIAVPRVINIDGQETINNDRLVVLAHLIGDGCYLKRQPLHYTNSDKKLLALVERSAKKEFKVRPRLVRQKSWYHLYLSSIEKLARGRRNPIVRWLDEELGIFNQRSGEKVIPEMVSRLSREQIAFFIKHLWATDGCVFINKKDNGPKVRLYYASKSRKLIKQLHYLLLRLGIVTKINFSKKEDYEPTWQVHVQGKENQELFLKKIGGVGRKEKLVKEALAKLALIKANPNNDVIPKGVWQEIEEERRKLGWSTREFHQKMGWAYSGTQRQKNGIGRKRLRKIAKAMKDEKLEQLSNSDVFWDEVKEIKKLGVEEVFDAEVPGLHNFIANNIIVHNSIEQDSDVVVFLYREDDENRETITCEVAKHRNGPVDRFSLYFNSKYISFFGLEEKKGK